MKMAGRGAAVDLTRGKPVRLILEFAVPLIMGSLFQQVYSLSDTMIAGHVLGANALASIGSTASLYTLMIGFAMGMSNGCGIVIGRIYGAKDTERLRRASAMMLLVNLAIGLVLTVLTIAFSDTLMRLLNIPDEILAQARSYMVVIFGGIPVTVLYNMCAAYMRALGNSRAPLRFLILSCCLNLVLDVLLLVVFRTGVAGAAWATVAAQAVSVLFSFRYIFREFADFLPRKQDIVPDAGLVREMTANGLSMAMMSSVVHMGTVIMTSAVNQLGPAAITADTAARRMFSFISSPMSNLAASGAAFISQNYGAREYARVRRGFRDVVLMELAWCLTAGIAMLALGAWAVQTVTGTTDSEIIRMGALNLRIGALLYMPLGTLLAVRQAMQALGMHIVPVLSSSIELAMKLACAWLVVPAYGYNGACLGEPSTWLACAVFIGGIYLVRRRSLYPDKKGEVTV